MKKLIIYINYFSPFTNSENEIIKYLLATNSDTKIIVLPTSFDNNNVDFLDRFEIIKNNLKNINNDNIELSSLLKTQNINDYILSMNNDYQCEFIIDKNNIDLFNDISNSGLKNINFLKFDEGKCEKLHISSYSEIDNVDLKNIDLSMNTLNYIEEKELYFIKKIKFYLSSKRLLHSESVAKLSYMIAIKNNLFNPGRAYIAGLLHDIGKYIDIDEAKTMIENNFKEYSFYPSWSYHQFIGYLIAKNDFKINDKDILDAIKYHCTGISNMNPIGKIIYSADKIDPLRKWDSQKYIEACLNNYEDGFIKTLKANREFLKEKMGEDEISTPLAKQCYEYYLK